jgi:GrpB-like predicted nucleotidyltransferase (UPF0157 family)
MAVTGSEGCDHREMERSTARLRLVPIGPHLADELWTLHQDPDLAEWYGTSTRDEALARARSFGEQWETKGVSKWLAYDRVTGELIGRGGLSFVPVDGQERFELGWAVRSVHQRKGYATEIAEAGLDFGFHTLGTNEIVAFTEPHNTRSRAVMEKIDMHFVKDILHEGKPFVLYAKQRPTKRIEVVDYDDEWRNTFETLKERIAAVLPNVEIQHVGSTAVPGLAAKPVIDMTVVVDNATDIPGTIEGLATLGYVHRGNLGIEGREAFHQPDNLPKHHLYLCGADSLALANHVALRDFLRKHPDAVRAYGDLKKRLADEFPDDIEGYVDGKTELIVSFLKEAGLSHADIETVERINRRP